MCDVCIDCFSNERDKALFASNDVSVTGLKLQICEEQEASGEETSLFSTEQKSRLNGTGGRQWCSGESKEGSSTEITLEMSEDKGKSRAENRKLFFMNGYRHLTEKGNWEWRSKEREDVSLTGLMLQICEEQGANEEETSLFSTKQKSRLNSTGGQQWCSGESKDVSVTGLKLQICEEQGANGEDKRLFSTKQKWRLNGTGGRQWCSGESKDGSSTEMQLEMSEDEGKWRDNKKLFFTNGHRHLTEKGNWEWRSKEREDVSVTGLKFQICEEQGAAHGEETGLVLTKQKSRLNGTGGQQWCSGESTVSSSSSPEMKLQINDDKGRKIEKVFFTNGHRYLTEDEWKWRPEERDGMAKHSMFGFRETEWPAKKQKQFFGDEIEFPRKLQDITVSLGAESNAKGKKESIIQASDFGYDFGYNFDENESERKAVEAQKPDSEDGKETPVTIDNAVELMSKSVAHRRSRKGIPNRRPRDDITRWNEQSDDVSESNGLVSRGSSPDNEGYDNWLNKRHEHNMSTEPEQEKQRKNRKVQTGSYQEELESKEISDEETEENLSISLPSQELGYQNGNWNQCAKGAIKFLDKSNAMKLRNIPSYSQANVEYTIETKRNSSEHNHQFDDSEISQTAEEEEVNVTDSWEDVDVVSSSATLRSGTPSLAVHSTILKEHNMADRFGEGIPPNLPGRHRWINTDESLLFHKHPSLFANQNEERKFLPIQQGYGLATGGGFADPTYPWGYFNNIVPMMYPVMRSDRMRGDFWAPNTMPSKGDLHLKRSLEVLNGKYDRENTDHGEHMKHYAKKQKPEGFNNTANVEKSKEEICSQYLQIKRAWSSDAKLQNGEYDREDADGAEHKKQHATKHKKSDISQEIRSQVAHLKRTWPFDSYSQNGEYDRKTLEQAEHAQRKEQTMKLQKINGFKDTTDEEFGSKAVPAEYQILNGHYDRESMDRGKHRKYHTQESPKCQNSSEVINGHGKDQPGYANGLREAESAEKIDREGEDGQMNQPQKNGSAALEDNHRPVTKNRHSRRSKGKKQALCNPWGKGSYSDLITMALVSAPGRKMTLHEIYRWITVNVPYFRDKGDELTSTGWKNSVRHTLSVRQRFVRLPRMLNGSVSHKSWWTLSDEFLRNRSPLEHSALKPSLQAANENQATQGTQTEVLVCGWCSCTMLGK